MRYEDCKEGVRVYWDGNQYSGSDKGIIVEYGGSIFTHYRDKVWVKWDSDGDILSIDFEKISVIEDETSPALTEEQAVMFLLSKGYTVSKN